MATPTPTSPGRSTPETHPPKPHRRKRRRRELKSIRTLKREWREIEVLEVQQRELAQSGGIDKAEALEALIKTLKSEALRTRKGDADLVLAMIVSGARHISEIACEAELTKHSALMALQDLIKQRRVEKYAEQRSIQGRPRTLYRARGRV